MYGSLGFLDNGRRFPVRDVSLLGSNGHPSRKELHGARRPEPTKPPVARPPTTDHPPQTPSHNSLLEPRTVFLEEQNRRRAAELDDLRARLAAGALDTAELVNATVLHPTVQRETLEASTEKTVVEGTRVRLRFPMRRVLKDGATQVWMQRRQVCPHLASVAYEWILLFEEREGGADRVLVGDFQ